MIRVYLIETDRFRLNVIKNFTLLINTRINKDNDVKYSLLRILVNIASKLAISDVNNVI